MNDQVPRFSSLTPGRERKIFEVLLSSPLLGAAEALALLGTFKDARGVGGAASLDAVRAVCTLTDDGPYNSDRYRANYGPYVVP
jgi:hypothetical protein